MLYLYCYCCWLGFAGGDEAATGGDIILFVSSNDASVSKLLLSIAYSVLSKNEELKLDNPHEKQNQVTELLAKCSYDSVFRLMQFLLFHESHKVVLH